jgi:hypothetical protein
MRPPTSPADAAGSLTRKWVAAWALAGPQMEQQRRREIRAADTASAIPAFDGLFERAVEQFPPSSTSGLVDQQRTLHRARK